MLNMISYTKQYWTILSNAEQLWAKIRDVMGKKSGS